MSHILSRRLKLASSPAAQRFATSSQTRSISNSCISQQSHNNKPVTPSETSTHQKGTQPPGPPDEGEKVAQKKKKTQAELDNELKMKLEEISGEGGAAGLEYEDGKPSAMKRSVRENMFRVI